jgi:exosome complex component RRP4
MSELKIQDKEVAVPGQLLASGMDYLPGFGTYRKGQDIFANRVGLVTLSGRAIKLTALSGPYLAKVDDLILAKVTDITLSGWRLDTNSAHSAMLSVRDATNHFVDKGADLTKILDIGDYVAARVIQVTTQNLIDVSLRAPGTRKLSPARLLRFNPNKFARIIGRGGSMVSMIKSATNCQIIVGQNGVVWLYGEPAGEVIASQAIAFIEEHAHKSGLTDKVKDFLISKGCTVVESVEQSTHSSGEFTQDSVTGATLSSPRRMSTQSHTPATHSTHSTYSTHLHQEKGSSSSEIVESTLDSSSKTQESDSVSESQSISSDSTNNSPKSKLPVSEEQTTRKN